MSKKHDENRDLRSVSRIARIDTRMKVITIQNKDEVGIHTLGRLDFLSHYCGYSIVYDKSIKVTKSDTTEVKEKARTRNAHALTNKNTRKRDK